jgi:hypothetical protein
MPAATARRLTMLAVLAMAGLDAAAANRLIDETPELRLEPATPQERRP